MFSVLCYLGINRSHLKCFGRVLKVNVGDEPAVRWALGRPEHLIKTLSIYALLDLQGSAACDLIDHPETTPVLLVHIWTHENSLSLVLLDAFINCDEVSWVKPKENNIHCQLVRRADWNAKIHPLSVICGVWASPHLYSSLTFLRNFLCFNQKQMIQWACANAIHATYKHNNSPIQWCAISTSPDAVNIEATASRCGSH